MAVCEAVKYCEGHVFGIWIAKIEKPFAQILAHLNCLKFVENSSAYCLAISYFF